jgi:hypothetical protein
MGQQDRRKETRDLGVALVGATLLLLSVGYVTRCTSTSRSTPSAPGGGAAHAAPSVSNASRTQGEAAGQPKSVRDIAAEEDKEESERIRNIGHALQTIGANPEARKTYGLPPP